MLSPYIRDIRRLIGHRLLTLTAAVALPVDSAGRVLLVCQADTGLWATIGGAIEPGEQPEAAAARETMEEAGVEISVGSLVGAFGGQEFVVRYPNDDVVAYVAVTYMATVVSGEPHADGDETTEVSWFTRGELVDLTLTANARVTFERLGWIPVAVS